ncbi:hypothetical protein N5U14_05655 [Aliarcobacter butzleri]|uniref:hypothetical protein n=1 Tax=Aliarcobacter butzleri TaxID=28197 RepID=UPI0021B1D2B2|nr:hypothetical protein [Aliarcobacter butzleri]MCT7610324.1 hypothetical protein [Aliarcobacter butzleri]
MKKIKINQYIYGIINFLLFIGFLIFFTKSIPAIIFGEVATKTKGIEKFTFVEALYLFVVSIIFIICLYFFNKLFISIRNKDKLNKKLQYSKCPKCKEVFNYNELKDGKCKYCKDIDTIDIEEYFKQYSNEL